MEQPVQPQYQQPVQPQYQQPVYQAPVQKPAIVLEPLSAKQKKVAVFVALLAIFALVVGIMHTFCLVDLPISVNADIDMEGVEIGGSVGGINVSAGLIADAYDLAEEASEGMIDESFTMGYVGLIIFGIANLLIAVIGVLYYLRARSNNPLYEQFFGSFTKGKSPVFIIGVIGAAAALLEIVCMWFVGFEESAMGQSAGMSVGVHWVTWVALAIYGGMAAYQLLAIDKNEEE